MAEPTVPATYLDKDGLLLKVGSVVGVVEERDRENRILKPTNAEWTVERFHEVGDPQAAFGVILEVRAGEHTAQVYATDVNRISE